MDTKGRACHDDLMARYLEGESTSCGEVTQRRSQQQPFALTQVRFSGDVQLVFQVNEHA
jgi:hypothetical protein